MSFREYEKFSTISNVIRAYCIKIIRENDCNVKVKDFPETENFSLGSFFRPDPIKTK